MKAFNGLLQKLLIVTLTVSLLSACGGKEERKAKYLERGKSYLAEKNYDKAKIEFKNVLQIDPKDAKGYLFLGQVEEKQKDWAKAFGAYKKASELDPELIDPRIHLAQFYLAQASALKARKDDTGAANALGLVQEQIKEIRKIDPKNAGMLTLEATLWANDGEKEKAVAQLEKVIAREPDLQSAAVLLSSLYDQQGRAKDAEAVLIKAAKTNPDPVVLQQRLAMHYVRNKQNDKAEAVLRKIVENNPDELNYRISLASFLSKTNQIDKAEQVLDEAIAADPEDVHRYQLLAQFLASRKSKEAAIKKLRQFIKQQPDMTDLQLSLARLYLADKQKDKAMQALQALIDSQGVEPAGLKARVMLAQIIAGDNMDDARVPALLKEVLDENPRDNDALLLKGKLAANHKDYVGAINDFRSILKDQPNNTEVLQLLAAAHLGNKEKSLALDTLRRGVESNPGNHKLRLSLAQLLAQDGDTDGALAQIDAILKVDKFNQPALKAKYELLARKGDAAGMEEVARLMQAGAPEKEDGYIQEARLRFAQKDYDTALDITNKVLKKNPDSIAGLLSKIDILVAKKDYKGALESAGELIRIEPKNSEGYYRKARLLQETGDIDAAVGFYDKAIKLSPNSTKLLKEYTNMMVSAGRSDAAKVRLKALLAKNAKHPSANSLLGLIYFREKDLPRAEQAFVRQIEITPGEAESYVQLARARIAAGKLAGAAQAYEDGLKQLPDNTQLLVGLAGVQERQQDYDAAIATYEKILAKHPDNAVSTNNLAALLADHRTDKTSLAKAAELSAQLEKTNQPAFQDTAGWVYYRQGDYDKAVKILKGVVEKAPKVPVFQYHLGMAYYKQGDKAAAREHLSKATDGDYTYQGIEEARATLRSL